MAYIGRDITSLSNASLLDDITFSSSAGPYNLTKSTVAFTPISAQALVISIDGVIQDPGSYTISGSTVTFDTSISSSCTNDFIVHNGVGIVNEVSDGAVTAAKLGTDAVTTAKILDNNVTVAKLPTTLDISGNTVTLPASVSGLGTGIDVTSQITGTVPTANLGSGTASSSTYLAGDSTYKTITAQDISWQSVETGATFTAVAGNGYPVNTTAQACTVTLPAGSVGDTIELVDYAGTWDTNYVTLTADGSEKIEGLTDDLVLGTERAAATLTYIDSTQGWLVTSGIEETAAFTPYAIDFLVVAGGGSGGSESNSGGGGAGGYRTSTQSTTSGNLITITVGDGGAGNASSTIGTTGSASSFSGLTTISSAGGGGGGKAETPNDGLDGGSGGGGGYNSGSGGASSPVTDPVQGYAGGDGENSAPAFGGGGGGGASEAGDNGTSSKGGDGGDGVASSISGSSVTRGGGGGGGTNTTVGAGGAGGGGAATDGSNGVSGTVNTGGGGGACEGSYTSGAGGKGVVILSMPDANYSGIVTGSPTVATGQGGGSDTTTLVFTGDGTYTT